MDRLHGVRLHACHISCHRYFLWRVWQETEHKRFPHGWQIHDNFPRCYVADCQVREFGIFFSILD